MNEQGYKVCPNGYVFNQYVNEKYNEEWKYLKIIQLYENKEKCGGCQFKEKCLKGRKGYKTVSRDVVLNEFYAEVDKNLSTKQGKEMKKQRSLTTKVKLLKIYFVTAPLYMYNFEWKRYEIGNKFGFIKAILNFSLNREYLHNQVNYRIH